MPAIILETHFEADPEICFGMMRDARIHDGSIAVISENEMAGVPPGTIAFGQTVTFECRHFGLRQRMTVKVVEFDPPRIFVDEMTDGRFKTFRHIHEFEPSGTGTVLRDTFTWTSQFGIIGKIFDRLLLGPHLRRLAMARNSRLKVIVENPSGDR